MKYEKTFPTKRKDEKIVLFLRRHWSILFKHFLVYLLEFIIPIAIYIIYIFIIDYEIDKEGPFYIILVMGASLYYLFIGLFFFHDWLDYYLDIWIVTDQRILNIEQNGLFHRVVSEHNITMVQDVTSEVRGRVATMLDYGDVHIQTAGEEQRFIFEQVPRPRDVVTTIIDTRDGGVYQQQHKPLHEKIDSHLEEVRTMHEEIKEKVSDTEPEKGVDTSNTSDNQIDFIEDQEDEDKTI